MTEFLLGLLMWTCVQMGVDPKTIEPPSFMAIDPPTMSMVTCGRVDPSCPIEPAIFDGEKFYYIEGLQYKENKELRSYLVHHFVHYIQFLKVDKNPGKFMENAEQFERDAMRIQKAYVSSIAL